MGFERARRGPGTSAKQDDQPKGRESGAHDAVLDLQRRAGNQATTALLRKRDSEQGGGVKDRIRFFEQIAANGGEAGTKDDAPEPVPDGYAGPDVADFQIGFRGVKIGSDDDARQVTELNAAIKELRAAKYNKSRGTIERVIREKFEFDPIKHEWTLDEARQAYEFLLTPYAQAFESRWSPTLKDESTQPFVFEVEGELVRCPTDEDKVEAQQIAQRIKAKHGITLSSAALIEANEVLYGKAGTKRNVRRAAWELRELRALETALAHVSAITGEARDSSGLAGVAQGVLYIGRTNTAGDKSGSGEYFGRDWDDEVPVPGKEKEKATEGRPVIGIYDAVRNPTQEIPTPFYVPKGTPKVEHGQKIIEGLVVHELGHGLFQPPKIGEWMKKFGWASYGQYAAPEGIERPPTHYGGTSAGEDMAESFALYFVNHDYLVQKSPEREQFIAQWVKSWTPEKVEQFAEGAAASKGGHKR